MFTQQQKKLQSNISAGRCLAERQGHLPLSKEAGVHGDDQLHNRETHTHTHTHRLRRGAISNVTLKQRMVGKRKLPGQRVCPGSEYLNYTVTLSFYVYFNYLMLF